MPVNRKFSTEELLAACDRYIETTRRKVFFEYVMLEGVNDTDECAHELARRMTGHLYHVNLIPYNTRPTDRSREAATSAFGSSQRSWTKPAFPSPSVTTWAATSPPPAASSAPKRNQRLTSL